MEVVLHLVLLFVFLLLVQKVDLVEMEVMEVVLHLVLLLVLLPLVQMVDLVELEE
jgi:hypothetical protein